MTMQELETARSEARHSAAGLAVAIRCVRSFMFLLDSESVGMSDAQWDLQLKEAMAEARELLHVVDGTSPVGEVPPIPLQEVPPIPDGPEVGLDFWRPRGND